MSSSHTVFLQGDIVEENVIFSLHDLSHASGASEAQLRHWVLEGILELDAECTHAKESINNWRFPGTALRRALIAHRLSNELDINAPGVALVLDLLDQIEVLKQKQQG